MTLRAPWKIGDNQMGYPHKIKKLRYFLTLITYSVSTEKNIFHDIQQQRLVLPHSLIVLFKLHHKNLCSGFLTEKLMSRAATIRLSHDIRIAIQSSRYDTYRDTFQKSQTKCHWCINTHSNIQCVKRLHNIL